MKKKDDLKPKVEKLEKTVDKLTKEIEKIKDYIDDIDDSLIKKEIEKNEGEFGQEFTYN